MRGSVHKWRDQWRFRLYWQGKPIEICRYLDGIPLYDQRMAVRMQEHINAQIDNRTFDPADWQKEKPFLFEQAVETWIKLKSESVSSETLEARERITNKFFLPFFSGMDIREIRRLHIDEFLKRLKNQKLGDKYVYNIMAELKACLRFHADSIPKMPTFPVIKYQDKPIRWLTEDQQDRVFEFIPAQDKPIFMFQRYMGVRPNEARGLLRENIYWDKGIIVIATVRDSHGILRQRTKTGKIRILPIIPEIEDTLKSNSIPYVFTRNGIPYGKRTHENIWKKANQQAHEKYHVPLIGQYAGSKHSFGMQRLNAGFTTDQLQAVFGHADIKSTQKYAKYLTESLTPVLRGHTTHSKM